MQLQAQYFKKVFQFNFKARTSRGLMNNKTSWFIKIWDQKNPTVFGLGECGPLPGLSIDAKPDFEQVLQSSLQNLTAHGALDVNRLSEIIPAEYPAILFGVETALLDLLNGGKRIIYHNNFVKGKRLPINGLIWMGDLDFMMNQINEKIAKGFRCLKLKVGGLNFDREREILYYIRKRYFREDITLRLDANGAFKIDDVLFKLGELSEYNIHSIEQPIKPGLPEMKELCRKSPIPIAFDEELIGVSDVAQKRNLLDQLRPQYIILKPTLHGGLQGCRQWIELAEQRKIGWWITSALESNIGLNAICQFTSNYDIAIPQGLGTGSIYSNNFSSPLHVSSGEIFVDLQQSWGITELNSD